jgi:prepilin-type processing-associated H-X9-DG protein
VKICVNSWLKKEKRMFCPKCGKENPDNVQKCWFCNWVLTSVSRSPGLAAKTSGLAITSLVLGILSPFTCLLTAIPAIIFGIVALVKIGKGRGQLKGKGLAIAGICVPVAVLPLVAIEMAIMIPALAKTRTMAQRLACASNLSGLRKAMLIYSNDYNDMYPTSSKWCDLLVEHVEVTPKTFRCPGAPEGPCNYAMNKNVEKLGANSPPDMILLFETAPGWNQSGGPEILTTENHQGEGCNILFVDSHVEFVKTKDLKKLRWEKEQSTPVPEPKQ